MIIALWIAQGFAALVLLVTGALKLVMPKEKLAERMHWAAAWPPGRIKLLGLAEVAGALGLVLPAALNIAPVLTPMAAACLAVLMLGAVQTHRRLHENFGPALVLALLCIAIAAGQVHLGAWRAHCDARGARALISSPRVSVTTATTAHSAARWRVLMPSPDWNDVCCVGATWLETSHGLTRRHQ